MHERKKLALSNVIRKKRRMSDDENLHGSKGVGIHADLSSEEPIFNSLDFICQFS